MPRREPDSPGVLSSGVSSEANTKERYLAEDRYDIARAMSDYSSKNRSKESSSEEEYSDSDESGSSYETVSDESSYEDSEDGHDDETEMPEDGDIEPRDSEDVSVESIPMLGGWLDKTCGWLDQPTACIGGKHEVSLLRESKLQAIPKVKRIENFVRARGIVTPEEKRSQRLERKGLVDIVKEDDTETVVTTATSFKKPKEKELKVVKKKRVASWKNRLRAKKGDETVTSGSSAGSRHPPRSRHHRTSMRDEGKDDDMHEASEEESVPETPVPFIQEDTSMPVSPIPSIGFQISGASLEPKDEEKSDHKSAHSRSHHSRADKSQRSSRSTTSQKNEQDRGEVDAAEFTDLSKSWPESPRKKESSLKGKSKDVADLDGLYLPESEDILSTSIKESRSKSRSKKREEETRSTRSEQASIRNDHASMKSEKASMRSEKSSDKADKSSSRGERTSVREDPKITDLTHIGRTDLALPGKPSLRSPGKSPEPVDVQVIEVLEMDSQDSWTPGKDMDKSSDSRRSRRSIDPDARIIDDDIEGHVTDLWQEEEEKLTTRASSRGRTGRATRTITLDDDDGSKLWAEEEKKVEHKGLTDDEDLADTRGRRETRTHGIERSRSKSNGASSRHSNRSKSRDPDGHTHREHTQFQSPDPSEEKSTSRSKRESRTVGSQPDPSPRPVANLEHRQRALESRNPELDHNIDADFSDEQKRRTENAAKRKGLREEEMKREALAHDEVNNDEGIRKSKSHDLRESTGRDPARSVSRLKSRSGLREQSHDTMVIHKSKSREAREGNPDSQVQAVVESRSSRDLRENDSTSHGLRPSRSRDLRDAGDAQDARKSKSRDMRESSDIEEYGASRGRGMRTLNNSPSKSSGRSKSRDRRSAEDREPVHENNSREIREIVESSDIDEYVVPQSSRSTHVREHNSPNKSMRQSRSMDVRESMYSDIPELAVRRTRSKSRDRREIRELDEYPVSQKSRQPREPISSTKSAYKSKSRDLPVEEYSMHKTNARDLREATQEVIEHDIRRNRSREANEYLDQDAGLRHSKSREERKREKRGKNPEALNAAKELRRLEKRLEKQLKQVKREQLKSELSNGEQQPQWDERSASTMELRQIEKDLVRKLKKDDEKRASKLKRLRQKPEFSKGQYESFETPSIQDKVRSQVQPRTIAQKVVDMKGRAEDVTRPSKNMSKYYSKPRAPRSQRDESGLRYD
jgi:hypothetical protein